MRNILIVGLADIDTTFILNYFKKYVVPTNIIVRDGMAVCRGADEHLTLGWNEGDLKLPYEITHLQYEIKYGDNNIMLKFFKQEEELLKFYYELKSNITIDKFIFLQMGYIHQPNILNTPDINMVSVVCEESLQNSFPGGIQSVYDFTEKNKIISGSLSHTYNLQNTFYDHMINLYYMYYRLGFYFIPLNPMDVKKQDLIGVYFKKNYKHNRDFIVDKVQKILKSNDILFGLKNYSQQYGEMDDDVIKIEHAHHQKWVLNHISTYLDYIKSVCVIIFENNDMDFNSRFGEIQMTEKTLKAMLFSKMNIPFILYNHPDYFVKLRNMGFWFLNMEFFDFEAYDINNFKNKTDLMVMSVVGAVEFIVEVYKENGFDLSRTNVEINDMYSEKMNNNYNLFINNLTSPHNADEIIDFILSD